MWPPKMSTASLFVVLFLPSCIHLFYFILVLFLSHEMYIWYYGLQNANTWWSRIRICMQQKCIYSLIQKLVHQKKLNTKATCGKNSNVQYQCIEETMDHMWEDSTWFKIDLVTIPSFYKLLFYKNFYNVVISNFLWFFGRNIILLWHKNFRNHLLK